jgi:outer membrane receptor protein involved in Fe transport
MIGFKSLRHALLVTAAAFGGMTAADGLSPAYAQEVTRTYNIEAQDLNSALRAFAMQTGRDVLYPPQIVAGKRSPGVHGQLTERQALEALLSGSGLRFEQTASNGFVLQDPDSPTQLGDANGAAPSDLANDEIIVTGSRVRTGVAPSASPVQIIGGNRLDESASPTADEFFRSIPQTSNVQFNSESTGVNDARGDVASVNLRGLGSGNTLLLLNGRRLVNHPTTQTENDVPTVIVNANTIPTLGVSRVEILRDAAGAIYGTDAVAGVVNTILRSDYDGLQLGARYGASEGTDFNETTGVLFGGRKFNGGRTNVSIFATYFDRNGMAASEREYSRSSDLSSLAPPGWEGDADLVNLSAQSPWGEFNTINIAGTGGQQVSGITNSTGRFHIQPGVLSPGTPTGYGTDLRSGSLASALRFDTNQGVLMTPDAERTNVFGAFSHELTADVELFGEAGLYRAETSGLRAANPIATADGVTVPRTNYWNPFGPVGSANRLPGLNLAQVPAQGLHLSLRNFRLVDTGLRTIDVESQSYRALAGLRGDWGEWRWESALLYSRAHNEDHENRISKTAFQAALARADLTAYNPFLGLVSANSQSVVDEISVDFVRESETSLTLWDASIANENALRVWFADLGLAAGVEWRNETYDENRDARVDGTITFTDIVTGASSQSDIIGSSPTPDSNGERDVYSAYVEGVAQLVEPDNKLPLVHSLEVQLAARFEHYSDFGDVLAPKAALAWRPFESLLVRASYSEGFRAPNLIQLNEGTVTRFDTGRNDLFRSRVTGSTDDSNRTTFSERVSNSDLEPEDSESIAFGLVFDPPFLEGMRLSVDYWSIDQVGTIGLFGDVNHIRLDDVLRRSGSFNPAVIREAPTPADVAAFNAYNLANGTSYAPAGEILRISESYLNLDPRTAAGIDASLQYEIDVPGYWRLEFEANAAYLLKLEQSPSALAQLLFDDPLTDPEGGTYGDLIRRSAANPEWRWNARLALSKDGWRFAIAADYVGSVIDESLNVDGAEIRPTPQYEVEPWLTFDGFIEYRFDQPNSALDDFRIRLGGRNLFDEPPPFADETFGYISSLHSNRGRYLYLDLRKTF